LGRIQRTNDEVASCDLFRHWILGFGSGDLRIRAFGAQQDLIFIPNVLLVGSKVRRIEHMIAAKPER
jgi:hypothetical protein